MRNNLIPYLERLNKKNMMKMIR